MKKSIIIILAICLILSVFCLSGCSKKEISELTVLDLPLAVTGEKVSDHNITFQEQDGVNVVTQWRVWDDAEESYVLYENEIFENNKVYRPVAIVSLEKGYVFQEDFLTVNMPENHSDYGYMYNEDNTVAEFEFGNRTTTTEIHKIEFYDSNFGIGNTISVPEVIAFDESGATIPNAITCDLEWQYQELDSDEVLDLKSSVFEENLKYILNSAITANEGYSFHADVEIVNNGIQTEESYGSTPFFLNKYTYYSTIPPAKEFTLTGLPEAKAGETMTGELVLQEEYADCYVGVNWIDKDQNDMTGLNFESGQTYEAQVNICPSSVYTIAENPLVVIDGKTYAQEEMQVSSSDIYITIKYTIS